MSVVIGGGDNLSDDNAVGGDGGLTVCEVDDEGMVVPSVVVVIAWLMAGLSLAIVMAWVRVISVICSEVAVI